MVRATFSGFNTALSALQANQKRIWILQDRFVKYEYCRIYQAAVRGIQP